MIRLQAIEPVGVPSELARQALAGSLRVEGLNVPAHIDRIPVPAERFDPDERARLAHELEVRLAPLEPNVRVLDSVRSLATPGAAMVVSGQQPGFLCAPLLNLYKALHTVRLARSLSQRWERPVIPVFWNHADDHDVAEVHHSWLVNQNLDLQKIALAGLSSGRKPLSQVLLSEHAQHLNAVRTVLRDMHATGEHIDEALDLFMPRDGESMAQAFSRSMTRLLGHLGLVLLEPDWIRQDLSRALAAILETDLDAALQRGSEALRAAGHTPGIEAQSAALVYRVDERGRYALRLGGEGLRYDGEEGSRTRAELAAEIIQEPLAYSPGALLRPVVQDVCLPVAAFVGGMGELAYHAQLTCLRVVAGAPATPFVPRASITIVDHDAATSLARLGVDARTFMTQAGVTQAGVARAGDVPDLGSTPNPPVIQALRELAERAAEELRAHRAALAEIDRGIAQNLKRSADQVRTLIEKVCAKAERAHANSAGKGRRHLRRLNSCLYPRNSLQERVLGPMPFVAAFGRAWIDEILEGLPALTSEHWLVHIEPEPGAEH
jgi:bacillithiol biosynthesis cysteine-adding enzyme BshC